MSRKDLSPHGHDGREFGLSETIPLDADLPLDDEMVQQLREKHYNATIVERIDTHEDLARFRIRPDKPFPPFEPGQYVVLGLGNWELRLEGTQKQLLPPEKRVKVAQRAYSISCPILDHQGDLAAVNSVDFLEFYVTLIRQAEAPEDEPPEVTPRLFRHNVGDRLLIGKKIVGTYTLGALAPEDTVLMLSTGTGEAPHNAMAAELLARNHRGRVVNVTCVRNAADLAYAAEHATLMERFPQYRYLAYTTRDPINLDPKHPHYVGKQYIQELFSTGELAKAAGDPLDPKRTHVFLCGNPAMIGYTPPGSQTPSSTGMLPLLKAAGFDDDHHHEGPGIVRFEKYW